MTYSCVKCSLWILFCTHLMRRLKGQDAVDTNAKCQFTFVMNVRAFRLICCVYLLLDTRCGAQIRRTITSPFQQPSNYEIPTWGPWRVYHVTCQRRWKSSQAKFKPGNPRSEFRSFFGSSLGISMSCTMSPGDCSSAVFTYWGRMTQICVFNTRLFSLHNKLNYAIRRACLRMVLLTDVYRNLTSLWINL